jgi:hypothetical protein
MRPDPGMAEHEASAVLVANAEPRSFRVISVEVPSELARLTNVRYDVTPTGRATILGPRTATLDPSSGPAAAVLTVGVPASAMGGRVRVAVVRFAADGHAAIRVPLDLEVLGVPRIAVAPARPLQGAGRGDRLELTYSIRNTGNARDTIDLSIQAPPTWSTRFVESPHVGLEPGEAVERTIVATIPTTSDIGQFGVTLVASPRQGTRAAATTTVEITDGLRPESEPGPVATLGIGSAATSRGATRAVESIALQGPIGASLTLSGRLSARLPADPVASRALTMLGYSPNSNFLSVGSTNWSATLGNTGMSVSELAGQSVFGRGGSLRLGAGPVDVRLIAAAPNGSDGPSMERGSLVGASASARAGTSTISTFFAHLRDSSYAVRALDAGGAGLELRPWSDGVLSGQLAARSFRGGAGLGAAALIQTPLAAGQLDAQLIHAPGGSDAFAPASDALSVAADRGVGRLHAQASYWASRDQTVSSENTSSRGWSLTPSYPILPTLTLAAYVQGTSFASVLPDGSFGSNQRDLGAREVLVHGNVELSADSRLTAISRAMDGASRAVVSDEARRVTNRVQLDRSGARGEFGIGGSVEQSTIGGAAMPSQTTLDAHVDRLQPFARLPRLTFSGYTQRLTLGDATLTTSRLEANLDVRRSTRLVFGVERGTARDAAGVLQTVCTFKVERAARLPALGRRSATGVVFEDRNGDGMRDEGEPGIAGIVVRRGAQTAVTDHKGVFRLEPSIAGHAEIDARSLPAGWLPSPRPIDYDEIDQSIGVMPTTALEVEIKLVGGADSGLAAVRLGRASLTLRDSAGRVWVARSDASSRATFDALPAGHYTLATDLDEASQPLIVEAVPPISISGVLRRQKITVTVRTRPLRIFTGQST